MTLRHRLALRYGVVVLVSLLLLGGLTWHEFATEKRLRKLLSPADRAVGEWGETAEVFVYSLIPIILIGGWWFTRRSLLPITDLARAVERIQADNLRNPLPRTFNGDEVDKLTEVFNGMTARLDRSFQQMREFTLHVSHELKTPLTIMRAELETAMHHENSYTPQQRECMHSIFDEVLRLTQIVDALTLLTRADSGQVKLERESVPLAELVGESFEDAVILAEPHRVKVALSESADVVVHGDRHRLRQLLLNLVDNAIKYNRPDGTVTMALRKTDEWAEIEIVNTGEGIPPSLQPRVFDRFVRGDEAHKKSIDGCGLGLTIAQWIVQAHSGTIQISSEPGSTTTAVVRLPLADDTVVASL